ncbi:aspartate dehydrogenase [Pseudochelatococcus sp. B33]
MKIGLIGFGAIGSALYRALQRESQGAEIVAVLTLPTGVATAQAALPSAQITSSWDEFDKCDLDIVVECAGHAALRAYGRRILEGGVDLVASSVGALADDVLLQELRNSALSGGARIMIPAGAAGGLDALAAARRSGLTEVRYASRKLPLAWVGTAAEEMIDLQKVTEACAFFTGNARSAALRFPQNANVVAAIALAGIGFDKTEVTLMADPETPGNRHIIEARGTFGEISVSVMAHPLQDNPKTSMLAPFSLARTILNQAGWLNV